MLEIFLFLLLSSFFLFCSGHILNLENKTENKFDFCSKQIIYGLIFVSFIALVLNFFIALSAFANSVVFAIILIISILNKKVRQNIISTKMLKTILTVSAISFFLIYRSDVYQPDAGLYHLPYTGLINSEKINIGIANIHHRFGFVTIMQYAAAIFNNYLFSENGTTIPLAILASAIIVNFYSNIIIYIKEKNISNIHFIYLFCVIIFISIKMSGYSDYGNDAPGHFVFFFLISEIFKKKFSEINFGKLLLLSIFIFLNKISFILILIIPITWIFLYKKLDINISTIISFFFLLSWIIKNILVSGCAVYPVENSCIKGLEWSTTTNQTINTRNAHIEIEAWAKGYPDQKEYTQEKFIKQFHWIKTWGNKHYIYILNKILPFVGTLFFLYFFLKNKNNSKVKYSIQKLYIIYIFAIMSLLFWFLKAPLYRLGYSSIILFITISYIQIVKNHFVYNKKNIKFLKIVFLVSFFFLIGKQMPRVINFNDNLTNKNWPNIYSVNEYKKIIIGNILTYNSENCGYTKILCTYYADIENKIKITEAFNYRIISNTQKK